MNILPAANTVCARRHRQIVSSPSDTYGTPWLKGPERVRCGLLCSNERGASCVVHRPLVMLMSQHVLPRHREKESACFKARPSFSAGSKASCRPAHFCMNAFRSQERFRATSSLLPASVRHSAEMHRMQATPSAVAPSRPTRQQANEHASGGTVDSRHQRGAPNATGATARKRPNRQPPSANHQSI